MLATLTNLYSVLDWFSRLLSEEKSLVEDFAMWVDDIIDKYFKKVGISPKINSCYVQLTIYI